MTQANAERARLIIGELVCCGVEQFIISPGFRSAPLALAAISHPSTHVKVHFDERGSAFFALGYGRVNRKPCAWITTSGTAAANGFPAVVEASMDEVPMICITADRPSELRDTGANQTIDQVHLFGHYPRWFADLPAPGSEENEEFINTTIDYAVFQAHNGPVHLNCMFREPLLEMEHKSKSIPEISWPSKTSPQTRYVPPLKQVGIIGDALVQKIRGAERGLIVVGRLQTLDDAEAVSEISMYLGWPVLPDICAPVDVPEIIINFFDLIVRSESFVGKYSPDVIMHFGGPLVSKELQRYLAKTPSEAYVLIAPSPNRIDASHSLTDRIQSSIIDYYHTILDIVPQGRLDSPWRLAWARADAKIWELLDFALQQDLSEPSLMWELSGMLFDSNWFLGASSMPIRDMQTFFQRWGDRHPRIFSNRGVSGIDGTLATASGIAQIQPGCGTVLLGDLALLHDLNSLSLLKESNVVIIVINNNGGGIFHMLPIALGHDEFEKALGTPHGMNFRWAAKQFQIPYSQVNSLEQFRETWLAAESASGPNLIEIQTDRKKNAMLRKELYRLAVERVEETI